MVNVTTVTLTNGVPVAPSGTVSTLDNLIGTAGAPIASVQTVQGISGGVAVKVDGSGVTQPVSGSITATISSGTVTASQGSPPWTMRPDGTLWALTGASANVNVTNTVSVGGTLTVQQSTAANLQATVTGTVAVSSGTVTANQGGAPWSMKPDGSVWALSGTSANVNITNASMTVSGTVGISGTVNASCTQNATWTVQPGNTQNTTAWLVTGTGGTFPITAASLPLPANAATVGNQPSNISLAAATASQTGNLALGTVVSANPTYVNNTINALSLDTSGALRVNVIAGSGGGGTSSSFGAAFPSTGTAIGVKDSTGTNMTNLKVNASNALVVDGSAVTQPVSGTFWQATQPISAASLPLPAGAATAANQTNGSQLVGITAGGNTATVSVAGALKVDGSAVTQPVSGTFWQTTQPVSGTFWQATQPVSGTVTSNQGGAPWTVRPDGTVWTLTGTSANVNVSNSSLAVTGTFWQATQPVSIAAAVTVAQATASSLNATVRLQDGSGNAITSDTRGSERPLSVQILDGAGNQVTTFGGSGGTASNFGSAFPTAGTAAGAQYLSSPPTLTNGQMNGLLLDSTGNLKVAVTGAGSGGTSAVDESSFTAGTSAFTPSGGFYQTTATANALTTGQVGLWQMTAQRAGFVNLRNSSGTELGGTATPLRDAPDGTIWALTGTSANVNVTNTVAVSGTFWQTTQPVSGTVTSNQGGAPWTVKPDGTGWAMTSTSANVNVTNASLAVTGTFWQATQPVSGTVTANQGTSPWLSRINDGTNSAAIKAASTAAVAADPALVVAVSPNNSVAVTGTFWQATQPVSGSVSITGTANVNVTNASIPVTGTFWQTTQPISAASLPLPSGAATSANQPTAAAAASTSSGQAGNVAMGFTTTGAPTYVTAQTNPLSLTTAGALRVDGSAVTQPVSGTFWQATQPVSGTVSISGTVGVTQSTSPWVVSLTSTTITGTVACTQSGPWNIGSITTLPALPANQSVNVAQINGITPLMGNGVTGTGSQRVTIASDNTAFTVNAAQSGPWNITNVSGTVSLPTGAATAANQTNVQTTSTQNQTTPGSLILTGAEYNSAPTAIVSGNTSPLMMDTRGQLRVTNSLRASKGYQYSTITVATAQTIVTAGGANNFRDVYSIVITNTSATSVTVLINDGTNNVMTLSAPAGDTRGFTVTADSAVPQAATNLAWTATVSSAVSSVLITVLYVTNQL